MVKNDWQGLRFAWIGYSLTALIWGFMSLTSLPDKIMWGPLTNATLFITLAVLYFVQARRWKPMNNRRQMAAVWGFAAHVPLAQPHPLPNVAALPLPFTIILKPAWPKFAIPLSVLICLAFYMDTYEYKVHGDHLTNILNPFVWFLDIIPLLALSIIIVLLLRAQRIEVTQEGLTVRHATGWIMHGTDWIYWRDARLFAVRDNNPGMPATRYELSCSYAVVQWQRLRRPRWWSLHRPAIPFAEYDAQMEALIALISGVTGLPLYDVR